METYNFWRDFFDSYRSSSDAIKALWLIVPPSFVLGLIWIVLHSPLVRSRDIEDGDKGARCRPDTPKLLPSPRRDAEKAPAGG